MNEDRPTPEVLAKLRADFASLSADAVPGPDCPVPDAIWEALRGELPAASTAAMVEHTTRCHACAEAWRLGRELAGPVSAVGRVVRPRMFSGPAVWAGLAAAALLIVVAGIGIFMPPEGRQQDVMRAGAELEIRSLVPETAPLPRSACVLKWSEPAAGARYTIRVGTPDLTTIATARSLEKPEYQVSANSLEKLPPGATIVWRVEADLPDGRRIASQAFLNRVE